MGYPIVKLSKWTSALFSKDFNLLPSINYRYFIFLITDILYFHCRYNLLFPKPGTPVNGYKSLFLPFKKFQLQSNIHMC